MRKGVISWCFVTYVSALVVCLAVRQAWSQEREAKKAPNKLPKNPLYMTDFDLENLLDQWEDSDEEKLPLDELPAYKRPRTVGKGAGGISDELLNDPDKLLATVKKGQPLMSFVTVGNNPTKEETELLTQRWQVGLSNMHLKCERFVIADDRAIFMFNDGSLAFEAKEFLLGQPELKDFTIDGRVWQGKAYPVEYPHAAGEGANEANRQAAETKGSGAKDEL